MVGPSGLEPERRLLAVEEKRRIVEQTLAAGGSGARVARAHGVKANQVFYWRKVYREGRLGSTAATKLLPVKVADERSMETSNGLENVT
jgi:transposase